MYSYVCLFFNNKKYKGNYFSFQTQNIKPI